MIRSYSADSIRDRGDSLTKNPDVWLQSLPSSQHRLKAWQKWASMYITSGGGSTPPMSTIVQVAVEICPLVKSRAAAPPRPSSLPLRAGGASLAASMGRNSDWRPCDAPAKIRGEKCRACPSLCPSGVNRKR